MVSHALGIDDSAQPRRSISETATNTYPAGIWALYGQEAEKYDKR
jgi:hypothetical protein